MNTSTLRHLRAGLTIVSTMGLTGCFHFVPDYTPFATGLHGLGVCLVCCAAVKALADLIKGHPPAPPPPPPTVYPPNQTNNNPNP